QASITHSYSLLMTILVKKPGAIQIQTVASVQARQPHHGPVVERSKDPLVNPRVPEQGEKACQCRLTGDLTNGQESGQHPGWAQVSHVRKLLSATQDPCDKA